jgi:hypothetical protein
VSASRDWSLRAARDTDALELAALVENAYRPYVERLGRPPGRAGFDSIHLYTHEKMTENLALYARIGYIEYERRAENGFSRVFMRKRL